MEAPALAGAPARTLAEELLPGLLRGVRMDRALGRFGAHWSAGSLDATPEEEYEMSEPVPRLDDFITHDWSTNGSLKFIALCIIYNSNAATVGSVAVAIVCSILTSGRVTILPMARANRNLCEVSGQDFNVKEGFWCIVLCPLTFLFLIFFWQRIRSIVLRRPRYAFVDKICINQNDEGLKREGICSLAGFLKHSDRLVVLWSPKYFSRLWCAFEVAAWIHQRQDPQQSMHFMPVTLGLSLLILHFAAFIVYVISRMNVIPLGSWNAGGLVLVGGTLLSLTTSIGARRLARDLSELPRQLGDFSVGAAKCFCCENGHVHPATGARLPCDRELIYDTIGHWFDRGQARSGYAAGDLEAFDDHVRTRFKDIVVASMGTVRLGYQHVLLFGVPVVWHAGDALVGWDQYPPGAAFRELCRYACVWLCVLPCVGKIIVGSLTLQGKVCAGRTSWTAVALAGMAVGLFTFAVVAALAMPLMYSVKYRSAGPQAAITGAELLLTGALYAPRCRRAPGGR